MKNRTTIKGMKTGAAAGAAVFVLFGIMAGLYFGSFGTLILLQKLMGVVEPSLLVRALIVMGSVVGVAVSAVICISTGGLIGTVVGYLASDAAERRAADAKA